MNPWQKILIWAIKKYQKYISPDHSSLSQCPYCRFYPSCSEYAVEAIEKKWVIIWWIKAIWRILRCQPWSKWWFDPVEKAKENNKK
jgi:putative membrane protein insertion efficiency factor